jgi:hypothetical protein
MRFLVSFLFILQISVPSFAQVVSQENLKRHITFLASDKLQGRGTGTKQEKKAADYIARSFKRSGLRPRGDGATFFHHFGFRRSSDPHGGEMGPQVYSQNVAGYLDNGREYTIVIGGHYDHLGLGHDHNSLEANSEGKIHNGADDNASGTAGVMELARVFAENGIREEHNFLFLAFSGEELGLVGSKRYTEYPTIDLSKVSFMLNMDMIGRLNAERRIMVGGVGTAPDFVPAINKHRGDFTVRLDSAGIGPSDHTSFYLKNLPVLFFFTGQHTDYHKPSDDTEKINFEGQRELLDMIVRVVSELDRVPKLKFQETTSKQERNPSFSVTLGIMPDYTFEGEGVHVDGVTTGKTGDKAGLRKGDIIVGMGEMEVKSIRDYMKGLSMHKKGDSTTIVVKRGTERQVLPVTFQ